MNPRPRLGWPAALAVAAALPVVPALAQAPGDALASHIDVVQVTATRFGEPVQEVPVSMTVITHDDLMTRGAVDLRTALALLGGATVAPGGDAGPAGATPALLGQREVDDFLLLIDGVPSGGAFVPLFETVSLNNVERIEVLRGTAPVYFGTTAFAGTINVIHYPAGRASPDLTLSAGSHGSVSLSGARALSTGTVRQSVALELSHDQLSDPRAGWNRAQGSYRLAAPVGEGDFRLDVNLQSLRQRPGSPTPVDEDTHQLTTELGPDFNQNPGDARLNTAQQQLVLGYDRPLSIGRWTSTLSCTHTRVSSVQGFFGDDGVDDDDDNATGTASSRNLQDLFFDTHVTGQPLSWLDLTVGLNELWGHATESAQSDLYTLPLDGTRPPPLAQGDPQEQATLADRRSFFGAYAQSRAKLSPDFSILAGLRWNRTTETRAATSSDDDSDPDTPTQHQSTSRLSGSLGALWEVWRDRQGDLDDVSLYANWGSTYQPAQIDFGIEDLGNPLLRPETQRSLNAGLKADGFDGRWDFDLGVFYVDFGNQPLNGEVDGVPTLTSGGRERFKGVEFETSFRPVEHLELSAHGSWESATYCDFDTLIDDQEFNLAGHTLVLSPHLRAGAAVAWAPPRGFGFSVTANYTGPRYLDELNTARTPGYTVVDASLAWRFDRLALGLTGTNLTDRRDPVVVSELGEGQFYRLPARRAWVTLTYHFE